MKTDTLKLPHGYTVDIHIDEHSANPFEDWDCEPPIAVFCERKIENYKGGDLNLPVLLSHIPAEKWETREGKREVANALPWSLREIGEAMRGYYGDQTFRDAVEELAGESAPCGWGDAGEYFDTMERVAHVAGVPCYNGQSNGYSQGGSALVFVAALPDWVGKVGAGGDLREQCRATFELWSAWAWGDVYGVATMYRPNGEEIKDGSCWGFYGGDHKKSGLMAHCESMVEYDRDNLRRERAAWNDAACRDIATV